MEHGRLRELRHDFRRYYHVPYDVVGTEEAVDLIETLPQGSRWAAATDPARAWSDERHLASDVVDAVNRVAWRLGTWEADEPPRVTRPRDVLERARALRRARAARERLESEGWEEM